MKNNLISTKNQPLQFLLPIVLIDFIILSIILFLPSISHLLPFPLYLIEPMRILTLIGYLFSNKRNGLLMALVIPIFSSITSGHPIIIKALLISIELICMLQIFSFLKNSLNKYYSITISIIVSKIFYYALKGGLIYVSLLSSNLLSTQFKYQLISPIIIILILFIYSTFSKKTDKA